MKKIIDEQIKEAQSFCITILRENNALFTRARKLQDKLGLGGLWRGSETTLKDIIEALQYEERNIIEVLQRREEKK